jgi:hypothetical protein
LFVGVVCRLSAFGGLRQKGFLSPLEGSLRVLFQ